ALLGGPIALVEDGDTIVVSLLEDRIDCVELESTETFESRSASWSAAVESRGGIHPDAAPVTHRVLKRMRATALPALLGGGMAGG
ncbi:MAG: dihydroxy-acid dehydratase, partial [Acidimicrobiales bacterium]